MSRLVVVSNRVAKPRETRAGGLATAMKMALEETGGLWFGWNGAIDDTSAGQVQREKAGGIEFATMALSSGDHRTYYNGFANRTLWPLLHSRLDLVDYQRDHFDGYLGVNRLFADRLACCIGPDDIIWVQDYHLIPLALFLRRHGLGNRIGFFLHTSLPGGSLLATLPRHRELFEAFAAYDLVGFQTATDLQSFLDYMQGIGGQVQADGRIAGLAGGHFRAAAFPIGIDVAAIERSAGSSERLESVRRLRASLQDRRLAIGVDRLDYSKGIPERFQAFAQFLAQHTDQHGKVTLLQIAPVSRDGVPEYRDIRSQLNELAGAINGAHADPDWVPIRYVNKSFQQATLSGYFRLADIGLVTPFRDGMNLVAKEYVAAQDPERPGVLVLSRFAGAAQELAEAIQVNPYDMQEVADGIVQALAMPLGERRRRWRAMMATLRGNDITHWRKRFLARLMEEDPSWLGSHANEPDLSATR